MVKKISDIMNYTIALSVILFIVGIVLIIFPELSLLYASYTLGICLIILGATLIYHSSWKLILLNYASFGILQIIIGIIILAYPKSLEIIVPISIGTWMILKASIDFRVSLILKKYNNKDWLLVTMSSVLAVLCGCILIIDPALGSIALIVVIGMFLTVYCLSSIINSIIIKKNISDMIKELTIHK